MSLKRETTKELGKLTVEQFERVIRKLPELEKEANEFRKLVARLSDDEYREKLGPSFSWAGLYERPFIEQLGRLILAIGRKEELRSWAKSTDPQEAALNWCESDELDGWDGGEGGIFAITDVIALGVALLHNILSIRLYHRSLAVLVDEVRQGHTESLFKAVRVDRSIVACPTIAARIAQAQLREEKRFFINLRSALKGPSKKHWEALYDLRYALVLLREMGVSLSDEQLEALLVHRLHLYPAASSARKNLRNQVLQAKKFSTI